MASRYITGVSIPRPTMIIIPQSTDILHVLKMGEHLSNLSTKYYGDPNLSWIIMRGNPDYLNEFEIPFGTVIRIPFSLSQVFQAWQIQNEI